jgi:hypothetical protein
VAPDHGFFNRNFVFPMTRHFNTPDIAERPELFQFFKGFVVISIHPTIFWPSNIHIEPLERWSED